MNAALREELLGYARDLARLGLSCGADDVVAARMDGAHVLVASGAPFHAMTEEHVRALGVHDAEEHAEICALFAARPELFGLIRLKSPFALRVSEEGVSMRASLDDTAQIAGGCIRTARSEKNADVLKALSKNFGCFLPHAGMLTVGRSLHEAFVAALVLEKGARAYIEGKAFGGAKSLSALDCMLMRSVYLKKYSQIQERGL